MILRYLLCAYLVRLTIAIAINDCVLRNSKPRAACVLRLHGGQPCVSASTQQSDPKVQRNFTDANNFQFLRPKSVVSEIDDSSTGESSNDSSNYDDATDLQEEFPNGFDPFRPGSAFLTELLEGPPLLGGELAKMITCDHKNDERLRYVTTTYNFALRWKKGRYEGQQKANPLSITESPTEILAIQEQGRTRVLAEGNDADSKRIKVANGGGVQKK
jgi:hypothetical protein